MAKDNEWRSANTSAKTALRKLSANDILKRDIPQPDWLLEGIIRVAGAAMVYGPPGIGKSWLTSTLAVMAAHGRGLETADGGLKGGPQEGARVLIYDGEMVEYDIKMMLNRLSQILDMPDHVNETFANIDYCLKTGQMADADFIDLARTDDKMRIINNAVLVNLVVFDNISTLSSTLRDENDATAWNPLNELITGLKSIGIATLLVHHSNRAGRSEYRGSSNLMTTLETCIQLKETGGEADGARMKVIFRKARNAGVCPLNGKTLSLPLDGPWQMRNTPKGDQADEDAKEAVSFINSLRYRNMTEMAKDLEVNRSTVSRRLDHAVETNLITRKEIKDCFESAKGMDGVETINNEWGLNG